MHPLLIYWQNQAKIIPTCALTTCIAVKGLSTSLVVKDHLPPPPKKSKSLLGHASTSIYIHWSSTVFGEVSISLGRNAEIWDTPSFRCFLLSSVRPFFIHLLDRLFILTAAPLPAPFFFLSRQLSPTSPTPSRVSRYPGSCIVIVMYLGFALFSVILSNNFSQSLAGMISVSKVYLLW